MGNDEYLQQIEEEIYQKAVDAIASWNEPDIYVVSFYFWEDGQNPCKPRLSIGFNTESHYREVSEGMEREDYLFDYRWNFAWWLQNNDAVQYGCDPHSAELIRKWVGSRDVFYFDKYGECPDIKDNEDELNKYQAMEDAFIDMLVRVVQRIHKEGILTSHFGKELPIIIHELEYYDEPLKINLAANGPELIERGFIYLCKGK